MGIFGELSPALWDSSLSQTSVATLVTTTQIGVSSTVTFANSHDYELGMRLYFNGISLPTGPNPPVIFTGWAYVVGIPSGTSVSLDVDLYGTGGSGFPSGNTTVTGYIVLEYATLEDPNFIVTDKIVHTSIINGKKNTINKGSYSNFSIKLNSLRLSEANRVNLSRLLNSYKGETLLFFPHVDKDYIKNSLSIGVEFNLDLAFKYVDGADFRDIDFINLVSQEYTNIALNIG